MMVVMITQWILDFWLILIRQTLKVYFSKFPRLRLWTKKEKEFTTERHCGPASLHNRAAGRSENLVGEGDISSNPSPFEREGFACIPWELGGGGDWPHDPRFRRPYTTSFWPTAVWCLSSFLNFKQVWLHQGELPSKSKTHFHFPFSKVCFTLFSPLTTSHQPRHNFFFGVWTQWGQNLKFLMKSH